MKEEIPRGEAKDRMYSIFFGVLSPLGGWKLLCHHYALLTPLWANSEAGLGNASSRI